MLNKSASVVLASFSPSTHREEPLGRRNYSRGFSVRQDPCKGRTAHTKCGLYLLGPSLAAALLIALFEHLAWVLSFCPDVRAIDVLLCRNGFQYPASRFLPDISGSEHVSQSVEAGSSFAKSCWNDCRSWGGLIRFRLQRQLATKFTQSRQ
jgi:predicted membrane metal-binding protein